MNIDSIIAEWTYRLEKGYPDCEDDYVELRNVLQEMTDLPEAEQNVIVKRAMGLTEDEEQLPKLDNGDIPKNDIKLLKQAFIKIAPVYSRYLKIFSMFDPNSLGTISEVLLSTLLNQQPNIVSVHTGGAQTINDLRVNGHAISLKTTEKGKAISLGSDIKNIDDRNIKGVLTYLNFLKTSDTNFESKTITDIVKPDEKDDEDTKRAKESIKQRINSIINKIAGEDGNDHYFVWIEKIKKPGSNNPITAIRIHTYKYDRNNLFNEFYNGYPHIAKTGWSITDKTNALVNTDSAYKYLNITPHAVYKFAGDDVPIEISLGVKLLNKKIAPEQLISSEILSVLNSLSIKLFGE